MSRDDRRERTPAPAVLAQPAQRRDEMLELLAMMEANLLALEQGPDPARRLAQELRSVVDEIREVAVGLQRGSE